MKNIIALFAISTTLFIACNSHSSSNADKMATDTTAKKTDSGAVSSQKLIETKNGITLSYFIQSVDFPDAGIEMVKPEFPVKKAGNVEFQYNIKNFKLTEQTPGAPGCNCNNSDKGQHIHQILNGAPYMARYKDTFYSDLKDGYYINLAFLSRSYHESVKNKNAFVLTQFNVGPNQPNNHQNLTGPLLFYSRPKGEYKGKDTKNLLLDFYLVNTDLAPDGNKVKATINGTEFILTKWAAYALGGLPMGENTVKLELIDKDGKLIPGPYNSVERKIKLSE